MTVLVMTGIDKLTIIISITEIMGVKRKAARLEDGDKKARNEAGLVLSGLETEQVMVEQVLREVKAPNIVQTNLDNWTGKVASHLTTCQLQKVSSLSNIKNFPSAEVEDVGFPGGKVTSCTTVGPLKTKSLGDNDIVTNVCDNYPECPLFSVPQGCGQTGGEGQVGPEP